MYSDATQVLQNWVPFFCILFMRDAETLQEAIREAEMWIIFSIQKYPSVTELLYYYIKNCCEQSMISSYIMHQSNV